MRETVRSGLRRKRKSSESSNLSQPLVGHWVSIAQTTIFAPDPTPEKETSFYNGRICKLLALVTASYPYLDNEIPLPDSLYPVQGNAGSR
jgi:hypothetical protein